MRDKLELEEMRERAYHEQGWGEESGDYTPPASEKEREDRIFWAGVEAGLLWAMRMAGEPKP